LNLAEIEGVFNELCQPSGAIVKPAGAIVRLADLIILFSGSLF
jgi:hypothetical protein